MPMRYFSSTAGAMTLTGNVAPGDTTIVVSSVSGLPVSFPYTLILDPGGSEELVDVTAAAGTTLTVTRGVDGTSAQSHSTGDPVRHGLSARDLREPQQHMAASAAVHGLAGSVVGTTDTQVLRAKTFQSADGTTPIIAKGAATQPDPILDVQNSAGGRIVTVGGTGLSVDNGATVNLNTGAAANFYGWVASLVATAAGQVVAVFKGAAGQTADLAQFQNSAGTVLAKVDKDGKLTAPTVTSTGDVSGATGTFAGAVSTGALTPASVASTGAVSGTTGTFSGAVSAASYGAVAATAGTFSGNVTAPNLPASTADTAGKRMRRFKVTVTPNGTGYATVTHGCGFTPLVVVGTSEQAYAVGVDPANINGTTFQVRLLNPTADIAVTTSTDVMFICFE